MPKENRDEEREERGRQQAAAAIEAQRAEHRQLATELTEAVTHYELEWRGQVADHVSGKPTAIRVVIEGIADSMGDAEAEARGA